MKLILRRYQSDPDVIFKKIFRWFKPIRFTANQSVSLFEGIGKRAPDRGMGRRTKKREALTTTLTTPPCYSVLRQEPKLVYDRYTLA